MAQTPKTVVIFVVAAVIGMIFLSPVVAAVDDNTGSQTVTNETVAAQTGQFVDLSGYDIAQNSETVYGYNDTSGSYEVASAGTDYDMSYSDGEIKALTGSSLVDDGEDVKVSYDYQASGAMTSTVLGFIPVMLGTLVFAKLAMGVQREM